MCGGLFCISAAGADKTVESVRKKKLNPTQWKLAGGELLRFAKSSSNSLYRELHFHKEKTCQHASIISRWSFSLTFVSLVLLLQVIPPPSPLCLFLFPYDPATQPETAELPVGVAAHYDLVYSVVARRSSTKKFLTCSETSRQQTTPSVMGLRLREGCSPRQQARKDGQSTYSVIGSNRTITPPPPECTISGS